MSAARVTAVLLALLASGCGWLSELDCTPGKPAYVSCGNYYMSNGGHKHVWWFDGCNQPVEIALECGEGGSCRLDEQIGPYCQCTGRWQGESCTICPGHWDASRDCEQCRNHWEGEDCEICPEPWLAERDCLGPALECVDRSCTDPLSGLTWKKIPGEDDDGLTWSDAETYCDSTSWDGLTGWRLPSIDELRSLVRGCRDTEDAGACGVRVGCLSESCLEAACIAVPDYCRDNSCKGCGLLQGPGFRGCYWPDELTGSCGASKEPNVYWSSSAVSSGSGGHWTIDFARGSVEPGPLDEASRAFTRCVRGP